MRYGAALVLCLGPVAAASAQPYAFVSGAAGDAIDIVDLGSDARVGSLPLAGLPSGMALSPDGSRLFVALSQANSLAMIDTATGSLTSVAVGAAPFGVAVDPSGQRVYVTNASDDSVSVVDAPTATVVATIPVAAAPVEVTAGGGRVYVANWAEGTVSVIDPVALAVVGSVAVGTFPAGLALDPASQRLYVANFMDDTVSVVDTAALAVIDTVGVGHRPRGLALDPAAGRLFVAAFESSDLQVLDTSTNQVVLQAPSGRPNPMAVFLGPDGERLYVAHMETGKSITVLDAATLAPLSAIEASAGPVAIAGFGFQAPPVPSGAWRLLSAAEGWLRRPFSRAAATSAARRTGAHGARRPGVQDVTIYDGTLFPSNWEVFLQNKQITTWQVIGGNPGSWRQTEHLDIGIPNPSGHRFIAVEYDPATQGSILGLDASWDRLVVATPLSPRVLASVTESFVVVQGGVAFRTAEDTFASVVWQHTSRVGLAAGDFDDGSSGHPDFSASGGPITFGYYRRTAAGDTVSHGIDNFLVTVHSGAAGPGVLRFRDVAGSAIDGVVAHNLATIERQDANVGEVGVTLLVEGPNVGPQRVSLVWPDGDGAPKSIDWIFILAPVGAPIETAHLSLLEPTGGATIAPNGGTMVVGITRQELPSQLQALVQALTTLLSGFSPVWLLTLAVPAVLLAAGRRRTRQAGKRLGGAH